MAAQAPGRQLTVLHERYAAGAATGEEMLAHRGEEGGVVVRGRIELTVGGADARARSRRGLLLLQPAPAPLSQCRARGV